MAYIREIITDGHPTLRKVAKKVDPAEIADPMFQQLLDDMFETMYDAPGIGLAAPQIGVSKRIFTVDLQDDDDAHGPLVVINPKFTAHRGRGRVGRRLPLGARDGRRADALRARRLHRPRPARQEDHARGHGAVRALPAARDGPSRRRALHRQGEEHAPGRRPTKKSRRPKRSPPALAEARSFSGRASSPSRSSRRSPSGTTSSASSRSPIVPPGAATSSSRRR